ncbi:MAG: hypothetical protein HY794_02720 [Desulfarculus sp.]|nr:hypothetical protein [Desulfarculus sp.]
MSHPEPKPSGNPGGHRRRVTTLAELVTALQDTYQDDRQVVRTLRQLMQKGHLRRLGGRLSRAA